MGAYVVASHSDAVVLPLPAAALCPAVTAAVVAPTVDVATVAAAVATTTVVAAVRAVRSEEVQRSGLVKHELKAPATWRDAQACRMFDSNTTRPISDYARRFKVPGL